MSASTTTGKNLLITCGDPCGIGPEIVVKALIARPSLLSVVQVVGHQMSFMQTAQKFNVDAQMLSKLNFVPVAADIPAAEIVPGSTSQAGGEIAYQSVVKAARLALLSDSNKTAVITAPLTKSALHLAGHQYPGHTELLAHLASNYDLSTTNPAMPVRMMLANHELRTVLVSIHVSLRDALEKININSIEETIRIAYHGLQQLGIKQPRIAVAGLNPHAGEAGAFGSEEINVIAPAIQASLQAIKPAHPNAVSGPYPPDTVFMRARGFGQFDAVIAMYHDQGLIPVKYLGIEHGVNVTLGLPFIRTSPDHGTALDIAGKGIASCNSLMAAIDFAQRAQVTDNA